jgi:hypothetical protein
MIERDALEGKLERLYREIIDDHDKFVLHINAFDSNTGRRIPEEEMEKIVFAEPNERYTAVISLYHAYDKSFLWMGLYELYMDNIGESENKETRELIDFFYRNVENVIMMGSYLRETITSHYFGLPDQH